VIEWHNSWVALEMFLLNALKSFSRGRDEALSRNDNISVEEIQPPPFSFPDSETMRRERQYQSETMPNQANLLRRSEVLFNMASFEFDKILLLESSTESLSWDDMASKEEEKLVIIQQQLKEAAGTTHLLGFFFLPRTSCLCHPQFVIAASAYLYAMTTVF